MKEKSIRTGILLDFYGNLLTDRMREAYLLLKNSGLNCILEWNEGNHFKDPDLRTAKAFAWVLGGKNGSGISVARSIQADGQLPER